MGPGELFDAVNEAVLDAASGWWTLLGLLFFCVVDGFFPAVPSDTLVVGLGSLLGQAGTPPWFGVVLVAAGGALLGDVIAHRIGRLIGTERFGWMRRSGPQRTFTWARHELDKRGVLLIFVGRFIPGGRVAINLVAGATRFSFRRFVIIDAGASLLWAAYNTAIGLVGGQLFDSVLISMIAAIGGAVVLGWLFDRAFRRFTAWLDRRGVHLDPEDYQDTGAVEVETPLHLPHRRHDPTAGRRRRGRRDDRQDDRQDGRLDDREDG